MTSTAAGTMDAVADCVPAGLVGLPAWERARRVAGWLPAPLAQAFYLECRLGPRAPQVDWIVRVDGPGREIIAGRNPRIRLPGPLGEDEAWVSLARFCAGWADDPLLRRAVSHLWLEFDLERRPARRPPLSVPRPSLFVAFDPKAVEDLPARGWGLVLDRILGRLCPDLMASRTRSAVRAVLSRRPAGATVPYLGVMLARPVQAVRVYLARIPAAPLPAELRRMGWPGDPQELAEALRWLDGAEGVAPAIGMAYVDVDQEPLPGIGVEYALRRSDQRRGLVAETPFLERLVDLGLCARQKRRGLESWPGGSVQVLGHELWASRVSRRVNHVKLLHVPGRPPEAKGYLLTCWRPVTRGTGDREH